MKQSEAWGDASITGSAVAPTPEPQTRMPARMTAISPAELGESPGWTHGWLAPAGARLLFVAGQTASNAQGRFTSARFVDQFDAALAKVLLVVAAAGGMPEHIVRMTVYVTDVDAYLASRKEIGQAWRRQMARHYPAMALVEVTRLVERDAVVELEVTAAVPPPPEDARG
ncbi:MAG TPA: RidA family protein [Vicinamibacterales bacterium]|nr:RidA family protein [Vicinamibacterales bacterium]